MDDEKMNSIFGFPNSRKFDVNHPRGKLGSWLYNECLISAIRQAGIGSTRVRVEEQVEQVPTSNMFKGLN